MPTPPPPIAGLILAGGQGSRMGGVDKGLVELDGEPLAARAIARLAPQVRRLLLSANRNPARYAAFGLPVLADRLPGYAGPLAGLDAGLAACPADCEWLLSCPCDTPFLPLDLAARLFAAAGAAGVHLALPRAGGRLQPACLLAHRDCAVSLAAYLATGGRGIARWVTAQPHAVVDFPDPAAFANLNTPEELAHWRHP